MKTVSTKAAFTFIAFLPIVMLLGLIPLQGKSQFSSQGKTVIAFSPFVDSISSLSNSESILLLTRQLAGDTTVMVDGELVTIASRHYLSQGNILATQWLYDKFLEYGYEPEFQEFNNSRGVNVIATKLGTKYPDKEYIICGHFDNMPSGPLAPGADDNASGTVAVLEAARILANIDLDYTVRFAAWDEEEIGLIGSEFYAQQAYMNGDIIMGVINLDMIAWDSDNDLVYSLGTNAASTQLTNDFLTTTSFYQPGLSNNFTSITASDHASFWQYDYPAILLIEDMGDFNQYYHTPNDNIPILNMELYQALVRASIANLAANALNQRISFEHNIIVSGNSTQPRETSIIISSDHIQNTTNYSPRLYYTTDSVTFSHVTPTSVSGDTFNFTLPGFPLGTTISYYFATQDSAGTMIATYPSGGTGISPPGTIAPISFFSYEVGNIFLVENCSDVLPIVIPDNSNTYAQIEISQGGELLDLDVLVDITHPRTTELRVIIISPDNTSIMMSDRNGGEGDNYTQTIFDDQAVKSIEEGTAPFTGNYRPETLFTSLLNKPLSGQWQLRIVENGLSNSGMLNQWCLHFLYRDNSIGLDEHFKDNFEGLYQNYPNPSSSTTNIKFRLLKPSTVSLMLFDNNGRIIRTLLSGNYQQGDHLVVASVADLKPGTYFYTLKTEKFTQTRQMVISR